MKNLVPIIGYEGSHDTSLVQERLAHIAGSMGYAPLLVDHRNILSLATSDTLRIHLPFGFVIVPEPSDDGEQRQLQSLDVTTTIKLSFPATPIIEGTAAYIASKFHAFRSAFDPDDIANAPSHIRETIKVGYEYIANVDLDVSFIARKLLLSTRTLERIFQQWGGHGAWRTIKEIRMQQARRLVLTSPYSLKEIGDALGSESQASFTAAFHEFWGYPPSSLRLTNSNLAQNLKSLARTLKSSRNPRQTRRS